MLLQEISQEAHRPFVLPCRFIPFQYPGQVEGRIAKGKLALKAVEAI